MKHLGKLAAVLGAGAIATTGLAVSAGSATAATPVNYTCGFTGIDGLGHPINVPVIVPVTTNFPTAPLQAGKAVPAGAVPVSAVLDLTQLLSAGEVTTAILSGLQGLGGTLGGSVALDPAHPVMLGSVPVTTTLSSPQGPITSLLANPSLTGTGTLGAFTPQGSGLEDVTLPASFTLIPSGVTDPSAGSVPVTFPNVTCTSATGAPVVVGHVQVAPASSTQAPVGALKVTGPKKAKHGKVVVFKVSQPNGTGAVVAKVGKKVVGRATLVNGAATLKAKGLKTGKDKVVFTVGTAHVTVKVTVR